MRESFAILLWLLSTASWAGAFSSDVTDLWWNPSESGWGMNVAHQGDILFVTLFTYDSDGTGMWLVGSRVERTGTNTYTGTLYRTTGLPFNTTSWNPAMVKNAAVGTVTVSFPDANHGVINYSVNGVSRSKSVTRQVFSDPVTVCR